MRRRILIAVVLAGCASRSPSTAAEQNPVTEAPAPAARKAPDFTLTDTEGNQVTLSALLAEGPVILAFFPKAFTGG
jgi:cytochrome oxidase Cu insertion factor (SCO1/SenC/PrrC family)